jgi:hypothetical protein
MDYVPDLNRIHTPKLGIILTGGAVVNSKTLILRRIECMYVYVHSRKEGKRSFKCATTRRGREKVEVCMYIHT